MSLISVPLPRLMLAAPASGQGKTSLTCALLQAALWAGLEPCAFKCGPDYIDPMFHTCVLGVPSRNLDLFFSPPEEVRAMLAQAAQGHGLAVLEGVMGFYDGIGGSDGASSWSLARETGTPVVLVTEPKGVALTLAASVKGLRDFRSPSQIAGVLLNQCTQKLFDLLAPAIERETGLPVFGYVPKLPQCAIPSRHLGLVTAQEIQGLREKIAALARAMGESVDLSALFDLARSAPELSFPAQSAAEKGPPFQIALARDRAFCFYYEENLDQLRALGGQLIPFSPLEDAALPEGVSGLYLGGGYPELYARTLSENTAMRRSIRQAIEAGMPALGECGGFLYLQRGLQTQEGERWPMVGIFSGEGRPQKGLGRFGYLELTAGGQTPYLMPGETIRGHEFHRWDCTDNGTLCKAKKPAGAGWDCMSRYKNCLAGFPHLYFRSNHALPARFAAACRRFEEEAT